jgi:hypothetical protein
MRRQKSMGAVRRAAGGKTLVCETLGLNEWLAHWRWNDGGKWRRLLEAGK